MLLYRTHLGTDKELISLNRWIGELRRVRTKLWNPHRQLVKDFHHSQDFFNVVMEGYILAGMADFFGCRDVAALKVKLAEGLDTEQASAMLKTLSHRYGQWNLVHTYRQTVCSLP